MVYISTIGFTLYIVLYNGMYDMYGYRERNNQLTVIYMNK